VVAGAGCDGRIYLWDVAARGRLHDFPTTADDGGVSLAVDASGSACFVGAFYAWGAARIDLADGCERWRRKDLRRCYGLEAAPHDATLVGWFDGKAGLTLDAASGETLERHRGLRAFCASRFDRSVLKYGKAFELITPAGARVRWAPDTFALLAAAFSPDRCVISEAGAAVRAIDVTSGVPDWTYQPRPGVHITALDFSPRLERFVALEYAYTDRARAEGPMMSLLHLTSDGRVVFHRSVREWSEANTFCANGELMLNGLGELHDVETGDVVHLFADFPR